MEIHKLHEELQQKINSLNAEKAVLENNIKSYKEKYGDLTLEQLDEKIADLNAKKSDNEEKINQLLNEFNNLNIEN